MRDVEAAAGGGVARSLRPVISLPSTRLQGARTRCKPNILLSHFEVDAPTGLGIALVSLQDDGVPGLSSRVHLPLQRLGPSVCACLES